MSTVASAHTDSPRRAGRWLVASGVVFIAGYVLAIFAPEGSLLGDLVVAPLALGALMFIVATALAARVVPARAVFPELTSREHEILELVAGGLTNAEIGRRLTLAPKTVRNYISNVLAKIHAADRADAVGRARRAGLG